MKNLCFVLLMSILFACNKKNDAEPNETHKSCLITRIDETGGGYTTYQYDSNRRLTSFFVKEVHEQPVKAVFETNYNIERDSEDRISRIVKNGGTITAIEYDAQGRWVKSQYGVAHDANNPPVYSITTNVEYNTEGLIAKTTATKASVFDPNGVYFYSLALEYEQKNLTRSTFDFTSKSVRRYEYYLDKEAKLTEVDLVRLYMASGSAPSGASPSKNLLKRVTTDDKATIIYDYTYEFNEQGYPTKIINIPGSSRNPSPLVTDITYLCD